jgi:hypothetical protein
VGIEDTAQHQFAAGVDQFDVQSTLVSQCLFLTRKDGIAKSKFPFTLDGDDACQA